MPFRSDVPRRPTPTLQQALEEMVARTPRALILPAEPPAEPPGCTATTSGWCCLARSPPLQPWLSQFPQFPRRTDSTHRTAHVFCVSAYFLLANDRGRVTGRWGVERQESIHCSVLACETPLTAAATSSSLYVVEACYADQMLRCDLAICCRGRETWRPARFD